MGEKETVRGFNMFGPIELHWDAERQELDLRGKIVAGSGKLPFQVQLHGRAAAQSLEAFRSLLDHVDEESIEATMPRDLQ